MKRRTVHKITPASEDSFDQQFWPVVVALTVLSGIAMGAVLTTLHGPRMWGSLLVLPLFAAITILLLFNLDNNRLRRSLQFAIISSLALHLMILVFASIINIFQNPYRPNERQVAQRRVRTIEISDQRASFVWQETNARPTPEPKVVTERQTQPSTNVQPQPVPVEETKPEVNPQLVRRETTAESIPRQNPELSQLKRQTRDLQPQSSIAMTGEKVAENKTAPATSTSRQNVELSKTADDVARQSTPQQESQVQTTKASAAKDSPTKQQVARTSSSPRRATRSETPTESAPRQSSSTARVRKPDLLMPVLNKQAPISEKVTAATTTQRNQAEASKSASQLTRRPTKSEQMRPALTHRPKTELSPRPQLALTAERRTENRAQPSISTESSVTLTPRRSTIESQIVASPVAIENPSRAPESETPSRDLNSKTLSVSRSTAGVAGIGRSQNLDRMIGGMTSPAAQASDSARRERTQSKSDDVQMLTSSRSADVKRSVGATRVPTSAFKAETTAAAKISGARTPGERTLESSAARIDAASTVHRDEVSAEKGNSGVDLGPIKVVSDQPSRRRSGGGQPEVSRLNPESTRRSQDHSNHQPMLVGETGRNVAAPRHQSSAPPSTDALEASHDASFAARAGGDATVTAERGSAEIVGDISDQGDSELARQLADSRRRASRDEHDSSWDDDKDEEDEQIKRGTARTRIAVAPVTRSDPGFGSANADGRAMAKTDVSGLSPSESVATKIERQSTSAIPGTGIQRSAANTMIQTTTSLPLVETSSTRRNETYSANSANDVDPDLKSGLKIGLVSNSNPRSTRMKPSVAPALNKTVTLSPPPSTKSDRTSSTDLAKLDSLPLTVARSELASMEQIQGSKLEILAVEGPAGLGDRPDSYIGIMTRPASRDSTQIQPDLKNRFRSSRFGGTPAINPDAVIATDAFRNRSPAAIASASEPTTEAAIHLGLEFLARYQSADGSWALNGFDRNERLYKMQLDSDSAATGLALLAFQGAGYNHREFKYARQIDHAIQWLIENQSADGGLYVESDNKSDAACRLYSHAIATLALTEAYGMTQDARLRGPAQKALDYIKVSQDSRKGGWRYYDEPGKKSSDTSVSGWMMMALQSGRLAGLNVDEASFGSVEDWLDVAADPDNASLYRYNPYAVDSKGVSRIQGRKATPSMTSVGLLMRIYAGWDRQDPRLLAGAKYLIETENLPSDSTPQYRDTYYWYYATQVLKFIDGPQWKTWNDRLRPLLTRSQEKSGDLAGSWHPYKPVPDRWGSFGGRLYVTTMNLLSLEVRHRMLPLYRQGGESPEFANIIEPIAEVEVPTTITPPLKPMPLPAQPIEPAPSAAKPDLNASATALTLKKTDLEKPDLEAEKFEQGNLTIVKKPIVELPQSTSKNPVSDFVKKEIRNSNALVERIAQPDLTRTIQPNAPTLTQSEIAPPNRRIPKSVDSEFAITIPDLKPAMLPDGVGSVERQPTSPITTTTPVSAEAIKKEMRKPDTRVKLDIQPDIERTVKRSTPTLTKPGIPQPVIKPPKRIETLTGEPVTTKLTPPTQPDAAAATKPAPGSAQFTSVSGRVTLDGRVLKNAKIEFVPVDENGIRVSAQSNSIGRFNIASAGTERRPGIKVAKYKIRVTTYFESPDETVIDFLERVPAKYNSKTELIATIGHDENNHFDLKLSTK